MTNVYIATVGTTKQPILDGFSTKPYDYFYFLTNDGKPPQDPKKQALYRNPLDVAYELKSHIIDYYGESRVCEIYTVDFLSFNDVLEKIIAIWKSHKNDKIVVNITGGTKIMVSAALIGAYVIGADVIYIKELRTGEKLSVEERIIRLPTPKVPVEELGESHRKILVYLDQSPDGQMDRATTVLASKLNLKKPTVSAHLKYLQEHDLIEINRKGRNALVRLTPSGQLLAKFYAEA